MSLVCSRCGVAAEPMAVRPMAGPLGEEILAKVCAACWQDWLRAQVMVINEYRLSLFDPRARVALEEQMRVFLNLPAAGS